MVPAASGGGRAWHRRFYGARLAGEIKRLRVNSEREIYVIFDSEIGFFQCSPEPAREVYCEAQSADAWPALAAVLTPERVERLHAAGFADPGHAPNYSKTYPSAASAADIAKEALTILHDVYGYTGASPLKVATEKGKGG